ncbi:MAG: class I SAM-dependent methyltransferase [Actinobacteria bacterium]|nr:class I SAM-dependent methyltransferase [Actinomycetota bacterium]
MLSVFGLEYSETAMNLWRQIRPLALRIYYLFADGPRAFEAAENSVADLSSEFSALFFQHSGRVCDKWHHYLPVYDRLFGPFRSASKEGAPIRFLEIGVWRGGSLEIWRKFFGGSAVIHGIDRDESCAALNTSDLPVHIGSQTDQDFLANVVNQMEGLDIVLDDGSHRARDQRKTFDVLFPLLSDGGLYVIEDTHTSYWWSYGGGFRKPGTAIEMAKSLVDGMHSWYHRFPVKRKMWAKTDVNAVHFFDSIIAIEKKRRIPPVRSNRGVDPFGA